MDFNWDSIVETILMFILLGGLALESFGLHISYYSTSGLICYDYIQSV